MGWGLVGSPETSAKQKTSCATRLPALFAEHLHQAPETRLRCPLHGKLAAYRTGEDQLKGFAGASRFITCIGICRGTSLWLLDNSLVGYE